MSLKTERTITRALEVRDVAKGSVKKARLFATLPHGVVLKTEAVLYFKNELSSGDPTMFDQQLLSDVGQLIEGRACIEAVSEEVIRVRYAEGEQVPANETEMVVGTPAPPAATTLEQVPGDGEAGAYLCLRTAKLRVLIYLDPYRLQITHLDGTPICGVGGPEKDMFYFLDGFNTGIARHAQTGAPIATENFDLGYDECIYGLGEKFIKLNKVGQTIELNMKDALGVITPRSYKNVPFYVSNKGYGVFFNHSSLMTVWVGAMTATDVQVGIEDDFLDYYIFTGSIKEVLAHYTDLTGKGTLPPAWTFGYWQSKITYESAAETLEIARKMRKHEVPCDVIHLDTFWYARDWFCDLQFDKTRFPDPAGYLRELADMGFKVSLWQIPYIPEGSQLFDDLLAVDGFVKDAQRRARRRRLLLHARLQRARGHHRLFQSRRGESPPGLFPPPLPPGGEGNQDRLRRSGAHRRRICQRAPRSAKPQPLSAHLQQSALRGDERGDG